MKKKVIFLTVNEIFAYLYREKSGVNIFFNVYKSISNTDIEFEIGANNVNPYSLNFLSSCEMG
jgi:hypothetical protein